MLNPAVVFLTSYTILQLYGLAYKKLWSIATLCFASVQLIGGLSFSALQYLGLNYHQQFMLAALVLLGEHYNCSGIHVLPNIRWMSNRNRFLFKKKELNKDQNQSMTQIPGIEPRH